MSNKVQIKVWWIPQVPMRAFEVVDVPDLNTAILLCDVLARYDLFQFDNHVRPDYANEGGIEYLLSSDPEDQWEYVNPNDEEEITYARERIAEVTR